jgi:hypothetical protein
MSKNRYKILYLPTAEYIYRQCSDKTNAHLERGENFYSFHELETKIRNFTMNVIFTDTFYNKRAFNELAAHIKDYNDRPYFYFSPELENNNIQLIEHFQLIKLEDSDEEISISSRSNS